MARAFYNENDPYAAEWLRNLIREGLIAPGEVDERSIVDLKPKDLEGFTQAHFFGGVGGWSYALRLAGVPDDFPIWTGSCPCQGFSQAGRRRGFKDSRHLWPVWFKLIEKCRPAIVFGEQVASPDGLKWLDLVHDDLERAGYAVGAADLCAAGIGAPHIRQRLFFVAYAEHRCVGQRIHVLARQSRDKVPHADWRANLRRAQERAGSMSRRSRDGLAEHGRDVVLGDAGRARGGRDAGAIPREEAQSPEERFGARRLAHEPELAGATRGFWKDADWWLCRDGKARPAQRGSFPLASRIPERVGRDGTVETQPRVGRLKAYGNAIVPAVAATFIRAVMSLI